MAKFLVTGMSCAACSARVEKAVNKVKGVENCSVSLLTNSMLVDGTASNESIIHAVEKAGYGATVDSNENSKIDNSPEQQIFNLQDKEIKNLKNRLCSSVFFLCVLMYFSMGHMMLNFPLPSWFSGNHVAMGLVQLLLTIIILVINKKFFVSGIKSLFHLSPNMDSLVALGSGVSFVYSVVVLFIMTDAVANQNGNLVLECMNNFYFEGSAMIVTLITVGKMLEAISKGKTTNALKSLMKLSPKTATIIFDGTEKEIPIEQVQLGDIFIVRPGENIPVDGIVIEGESSVNESSLTGESMPVDKFKDSKVFSATINLNGFIKCKATKVGQETTLSQIIQLVKDSAATKAPIAKIADKVSGIFVPVVIFISIITFVVWSLVGAEFSFSLARAISVLVISCPCALGLATPVAIMVGNGVGAKNGILFKTSSSLEQASKIKNIALDKTGTITKGEPEVIDIILLNEISKHDFVKLAASLELKSEHPLAKAVVNFYKANSEFGNDFYDVKDFVSLTGSGVSGIIDDKKIFAGNYDFINSIMDISSIKNRVNEISEQGMTPLVFCSNENLLGIIATADVIKDDSKQAILQLKSMGINPVMITGDNEKTAMSIAKKVCIDKVIAGMLPGGKTDAIKSLKANGKTAMAGDGINDAPALTSADIGIAVGGGSDIALDAAEIVLMKNSLLDVPAAIRLSKATLKNIHQNLFWAFFYNVIGIPLAAGAYYKLLGWSLNPMFAAAAMSLSSFCVVTNALRLNLFNPYKVKNRPKNKQKEASMPITEKTFKVEGMMCSHCEAHVQDELKKIKGIEEAIASHEKGEVLVKFSKNVDDKKVSDAIKKAGYAVV